MRLIGTLPSPQEAQKFCSFLMSHGIQCSFEVNNQSTIWIEDEDQASIALDYLEHFQQNPENPLFQKSAASPPPPPPTQSRWKIHPPTLSRSQFAVTYLFIIVCVLLFIWNTYQQIKIVQKNGPVAIQLALTPLQRDLFYDYPQTFQNVESLVQKESLKPYKTIDELPLKLQERIAQIEQHPYWKGIYFIFLEGYKKAPLFEKISQGEFWRLFTPCLLHANLLHILFNMLWLWLLGKQIEPRIGGFRLILMALIIGIISNTSQYLMSGSAFLGFSGIICGMAGFIWVRQKVAPWEGYPLKRSILIFLAVFVLGMFALQLVAFILQLLNLFQFPLQIANTAHIVGGLSGMALAKIPYFARVKK